MLCLDVLQDVVGCSKSLPVLIGRVDCVVVLNVSSPLELPSRLLSTWPISVRNTSL